MTALGGEYAGQVSGCLLPVVPVAVAQRLLLLLLLLPGPGTGGLGCLGRVVQGRDQVRPQGHPLAVQVVGYLGHNFQGQVALSSQCKLGPHVDSIRLIIEQGNLGLAEN